MTPPANVVSFAGFEALLQAAYVKHAVCRDVSYAALRDMGFAYAGIHWNGC
jgi:hypothetical protein